MSNTATHCPVGHPLEGESRQCIECRRIRDREYKRRKAGERVHTGRCARGHRLTRANSLTYKRLGKPFIMCRTCHEQGMRERGKPKPVPSSVMSVARTDQILELCGQLQNAPLLAWERAELTERIRALQQETCHG